MQAFSSGLKAREEIFDQIKAVDVFDCVIIGGGATGLGCGVDSASRSFKTLVIEEFDFAKGTSSRSTKLIHGGLRYLQKGDIFLVLEALKERGLLCQNAPHMVAHQPFIVPNYKWWEGPFYAIGLKVYDLLAGRLGLEPSLHLKKERVLECLPTLESAELKGGVEYYDGQFDDARLAMTLMHTIFDLRSFAINYTKAVDFVKEEGRIKGVLIEDVLTKKQMVVKTKGVINATGPFSDKVRTIDDPKAEKLVVPSQGIHLVLDRSFLPGSTAMIIPHTDDGRVLFLVPWHRRVLVGTTDTKIQEIDIEPKPLEQEIEFVLEQAARFLTKKPTKQDIKSCFAGIRPLIKQPGKSTKDLSRNHQVLVSGSGLITIAGGKWTTYRKMAQDCVDQMIEVAHLEKLPCKTHHLHLHGYLEKTDPVKIESSYGTDLEKIHQIQEKEPELKELVHPDFPYTYAHLIFSIRYELAQTVEDLLSRRVRLLLLDAKGAQAVAKRVAALLAKELNKESSFIEEQTKNFNQLASQYFIT
jgi:glycerol-3-phosphate dehydrogenase